MTLGEWNYELAAPMTVAALQFRRQHAEEQRRKAFEALAVEPTQPRTYPETYLDEEA